MLNADKQHIIQMVALWRERSGLSIQQIIARPQFENRFTTRADKLSDIRPDLTLALLRAFTQDLTSPERCTIEEAKAFATLTRLPLNKFRDLDTLFSRAEPSNIEMTPPVSPARQHWGEASAVDHFQGRTDKLDTLESWILEEGCRFVGVLGFGGVGKTALVTKLAERIQAHFHYLIWISLRNAPPLVDTLDVCLQVLSPHQADHRLNDQNVAQKIKALIDNLHRHRCLIILDNVEIILQEQAQAGHYRPEYEIYGQLFQRVGEARHQSCVILTSREKPKEFVHLEGSSVRLLRLDGLQSQEAQAMLGHKDLSGDHNIWQDLTDHYSGNPLALKLATEIIRDVFGGDIQAFLQQGQTIFGEIRDELDQQFSRLSPLEQGLMFWLAIERESVSPAVLRETIISPLWKEGLSEALLSLRRRSLIEQSGIRVTLQNVIMEYVTNRLIEQIWTEITQRTSQGLNTYALMKAQAKEYVRQIQKRLILDPLISRLVAKFGRPEKVAQSLLQILSDLRDEGQRQPSYAAGNILNLLRHLKQDLRGSDFSNLTIWQADLQDLDLH